MGARYGPERHSLDVVRGDPAEATRAAGRMFFSENLFLGVAIVHTSVSFFWTLVLWWTLPQRHTFWWALAASVAIALLDLGVIAPAFFPEVAALAFWPQLADHLAWGACVGLVFMYRR